MEDALLADVVALEFPSRSGNPDTAVMSVRAACRNVHVHANLQGL
jgi:hypothetical protein